MPPLLPFNVTLTPSPQPNVVAMNLLSEMVVGVSDWLPWLQAFRNESLIPLLVQMMDDRLKVRVQSVVHIVIINDVISSSKLSRLLLRPCWGCLLPWQPVVLELSVS